MVKVIPHNAWNYSTLNNFNNSNLPNQVVRKNIVLTQMRNEMKIRDPSVHYKNFYSWREKVRAPVEDKIINEIDERGLPEEESWKIVKEKKKLFHDVLEKSDYVSRKEVNEILYGDFDDENRRRIDRTFS
jgi:hypothetical protein